MGAHAVLSASSAERWINCPPSARLGEQFEDTASSYAEEGTLAHEVAELAVRRCFRQISEAEAAKTLERLKSHELFDQEMIRHAETYRDYINEIALGVPAWIKPYVAFEQKLDFSDWAPEGFGTADALIIADGFLHIVDYKYGKGVPVSAEENSQLRLYALGALQNYGALFDVSEVRLHVVQPRLGSITSWSEPVENLWDWGNEIAEAAKQAFAGSGELNPGKWCRFCRAGALCRARAEANMDLARHEFKDPKLLEPDEIAEVMAKADEVRKWAEAVESYALNAMLEGRDIPGLKLVEGRSVRKLEDQDRAFNKLIQAGIEEALLYERKPVTLTTIEKIIPKDLFREWATTEVIKPPGKPAVVPATDKRPEYKMSQAMNEFKD